LTKAEFILDGTYDELARLTAEVSQFCQANQLSSEVDFDLNLALEELFVNIVKHGGCQGIPGAAQIQLQFDGQDVLVVFRDRGVAFNPFDLPPLDPVATLEQRRRGGLGIHLVRQIMADLEYQRVDGWNRITMRRAIPATVFKG
jgi:anti-sigma regulatory factor (Ser/Thr protein kinase)